ncbi:hypothetical protein D3C86_1368250 [compost metagenome]
MGIGHHLGRRRLHRLHIHRFECITRLDLDNQMAPVFSRKAIGRAGTARVIEGPHQVRVCAQVLGNGRRDLEPRSPLPHLGLLDKQGLDRMRLEEGRQGLTLGCG